MHHSEIDDQGDVPTDTSYTIDERGVRKLLFKKRSTSSTGAVRNLTAIKSIETSVLILEFARD
jgi:hypothetical protein